MMEYMEQQYQTYVQDQPWTDPCQAPKDLRDEFAMAALSVYAREAMPDEAARLSYQYADAMMEARKGKT